MTISVRNPRTGQVDCEFEPPAEAQLQQMCTDLREHQIEWYTQGIDHRIAAVKAWKSVLIQNREVLMDALTLDTGRLHETVAEIDSVPTVIDQWCEIATDFFRPQVSKETSVPFIHLQQQFIPYPLVGVISPWNVPHVLAHIDAIPAMLAGCAVIIKPSEFTPRFVEPLQQVAASIPEIGAVLRYVQGAGEAGAALVDTVDLVCFTGSIKTGRQVGERASQNFIPCFLELGGKDAAVVLETANIDRAASAILWGSVVNAGQSCLSIERIYVAQAIHDEFVARLVSKAERLRLAHPEPDSGEIGPIISPDQAAIIIDHLHDAVKKGAVVHCGGELESHEGGEWIRPTVLSNVDHDMKVMTEETFGPVMPVMSFSSVEEAVALANGTDYGLSGAVFAGNEEEAMEVASRMEAGAVSINDAGLTAIVHDGEKNSFKFSGLGGTRMGPSSIERFLRKKALYVNTSSEKDPWWYG